jgi:hypothetical protein
VGIGELMGSLGSVIRSLLGLQSAKTGLKRGTIQQLGNFGDHLVLIDGELVTARVTTDEDFRVGQIVHVQVSLTNAVILGGAR